MTRAEIRKRVSEYFGVDEELMASRSRKTEVLRARHCYIYIMYCYYKTYQATADRLNYDVSAVRSAVEKYKCRPALIEVANQLSRYDYSKKSEDHVHVHHGDRVR